MNFAEKMSSVEMLPFTRKSSEWEMLWVYITFRTIHKIFPNVISSAGCEGNYLRAVVSDTHLNVSAGEVPIFFCK
jgi:hypothetical protein